jgi:hypothetical protein
MAPTKLAAIPTSAIGAHYTALKPTATVAPGGDVFTLPHGVAITLTENSDIVPLFAETDADLERRFPPVLRPV